MSESSASTRTPTIDMSTVSELNDQSMMIDNTQSIRIYSDPGSRSSQTDRLADIFEQYFGADKSDHMEKLKELPEEECKELIDIVSTDNSEDIIEDLQKAGADDLEVALKSEDLSDETKNQFISQLIKLGLITVEMKPFDPPTGLNTAPRTPLKMKS